MIFVIKKVFATSFLLFLFSCADKNFFSFSAETAEGNLFLFESLKENKASVFVFLSPDCPLSQNYTLPLKMLQENFSAKGIKFFAVFPGIFSGKNEIKKFAEEFHFAFPLLLDEKKELVGFFNATITPEVFVVNKKGETVYSGSVDNWYEELGKKREVITRKYLEDALNAIVSDEEIKTKKTKAVGCFIE